MFFFVDEPSVDYDSNNKKHFAKTVSLQSKNGKAFEYATLRALHQHLSGQEVAVKKTEALRVAEQSWKSIDDELKAKMSRAATAAVRVLLRLEPQLENACDNAPLYLSVQKDAAGVTGDVRDVLTVRLQNAWEIGLSCKHNHAAVKHSRLSKRLDFGKAWFDLSCSDEYFKDVAPLFAQLELLKASGALWKDVPDKENTYYKPLLAAFIKEMQSLYSEHGKIIPERLLQYLLGRNDFYKIITSNSDELTTIQAFNFHGTLNRNAAQVMPQQKIPKLALPSKIYNIDFKENSSNTLEIVCSDGWTIKMRIHNASSKVEPSLKFDVSLEGHPASLYSQREPW